MGAPSKTAPGPAELGGGPALGPSAEGAGSVQETSSTWAWIRLGLRHTDSSEFQGSFGPLVHSPPQSSRRRAWCPGPVGQRGACPSEQASEVLVRGRDSGEAGPGVATALPA